MKLVDSWALPSAQESTIGPYPQSNEGVHTVITLGSVLIMFFIG
jgi:hypothetical protein